MSMEIDYDKLYIETKLRELADLMEYNSKLIKEKYPNGPHAELGSAAKIAKYWLDILGATGADNAWK